MDYTEEEKQMLMEDELAAQMALSEMIAEFGEDAIPEELIDEIMNL